MTGPIPAEFFRGGGREPPAEEPRVSIAEMKKELASQGPPTIAQLAEEIKAAKARESKISQLLSVEVRPAEAVIMLPGLVHRTANNTVPFVPLDAQAFSQQLEQGRPQRVEAYLGDVESIINFVESGEAARMLDSDIALVGAQADLVDNPFGNFVAITLSSAFNIATTVISHPLQTGKVFLNGLWTASRTGLQQAVSAGAIPQIPAEAARILPFPTETDLELANEVFIGVGSSLAGGVGGFFVGGPVGAIVGAFGGPVAADIARGKDPKEIAENLGTDLGVGSVALAGGIVLRAGAGSIKAGVRGAAARKALQDPELERFVAEIESLVDDLEVVDKTIDTSNRTVNDPTRPLDPKEVQQNGYTLEQVQGGSHNIRDPAGNIVAKGILTVDEATAKIAELPNLAQTAPHPTALVDLPSPIKQGFFATAVQSLEDLVARNIPWLSNAKSRFEAAERAYNTDWVTRYLIPIQEGMVRYTTRMGEINSRFFKPIDNVVDRIYKDLTPEQRAAKLRLLSGYIETMSAEEIVDGKLFKKGRAVTDEEQILASRIVELGADLKLVHGYISEVRSRIRGIPEDQLDEVLDGIRTEVMDAMTRGMDEGAKKAFEETAWIYNAIRETDPMKLDQYTITRLAEAISGKLPNRAEFAARTGLDKNDIILATMIEETFEELGKARMFPEEMLRGYVSHMRTYGKDSVQRFSGNPVFKRTGQAAVDMKRTGEVWNYETNILENLDRYVKHTTFMDEVGNIWHEGAQEVTKTLRAHGIQTNSTQAKSILNFFNDVRGMPTYDAINMRNALDDFARDTGLEKFFGINGNGMLKFFTSMLGTGLLGFRPSLAMRDLLDAMVAYSVPFGYNRSGKAFTKNILSYLTNKKAYEADMNALKAQGHITDYSATREMMDMLGPSNNPLVRAAEKYAIVGERWSLQPQVFEFNQTVILRDMLDNVGGLMRKLQDGKINKAAFDKQSGLLYQSDATIRKINELIAQGLTDEATQMLAQTTMFDIMGRYGFGFAPIGRGPVEVLLFNFRNYPTTRRASLFRAISRGPSAATRAGNFLRLVGYETMLRTLVAPPLGIRAAKYSQSMGVMYSGGPMADVLTDFSEAAAMGDNNSFIGVGERLARMLIPFRLAGKDIVNLGQVIENTTNP